MIQLVERESFSLNLEGQHAILSLLQNKLEALGFYVILMPGKETGGYLYARPLQRNKNNPIQLLIGHCDTVWDINTLNDMPVLQKNGTMSGPGIYDMKAGLTQMIFAIQTLQELSLELSVSPVILVNSDEEIGSKK